MFEGYVQAKNARRKTWKKKYSSLEMLPEENIRAYNQRITEAVSGIRNNGGEIS